MTSTIHAMRSSRPKKARLGMAGYVELLATFRDAPATILQAQERLRWGRDTLHRLVVAFHAKGLIHVCGWYAAAKRRRRVALYAFGPGQDVPPPSESLRILTPTKPSPEVWAFASVIEELAEPCTVVELTEHTGIDWDTAKAVVVALQKHRLARVLTWRPRENSGGIYQAVYALGAGPNAPYPSRKAMRRRTAKAWYERAARKKAAAEITSAICRPANAPNFSEAA